MVQLSGRKNIVLSLSLSLSRLIHFAIVGTQLCIAVKREKKPKSNE